MANQAVTAVQSTDMLLTRGRALEDPGVVLMHCGRSDDAQPVVAQAIRLYRQKGVTVLAERAQRMIG